MSPVLPSILFALTLLSMFALAAVIMIFQGKLRKMSTDRTRFLAMLLFSGPFLMGMFDVFDILLVQSFWGPVFGPPLFVMVIFGPGFGALLLFVLSFDLVSVQLSSDRESETGVDTDFGACV